MFFCHEKKQKRHNEKREKDKLTCVFLNLVFPKEKTRAVEVVGDNYCWVADFCPNWGYYDQSRNAAADSSFCRL